MQRNQRITVHVSGSIGAFGEDPPEVGDAGHGHGQEPLHQHQRLLLRGDLGGKHNRALQILLKKRQDQPLLTTINLHARKSAPTPA